MSKKLCVALSVRRSKLQGLDGCVRATWCLRNQPSHRSSGYPPNKACTGEQGQLRGVHVVQCYGVEYMPAPRLQARHVATAPLLCRAHGNPTAPFTAPTTFAFASLTQATSHKPLWYQATATRVQALFKLCPVPEQEGPGPAACAGGTTAHQWAPGYRYAPGKGPPCLRALDLGDVHRVPAQTSCTHEGRMRGYPCCLYLRSEWNLGPRAP